MLDNVARRYFYGCNGGLFAFHFNSKRLNFFSESRCDLSCERSDGERERERYEMREGERRSARNAYKCSMRVAD